MRILFINNDGGGFADEIDIADGTTVEQLFQQRLPHGKPADYLIRVNRQPTTREAVLQPGDRISITPTKIEGACRSRSFMKGPVWEPEPGSTRFISPAA
jgi:hypothetical protein